MKKILVVDNSPVMLQFMRNLLEKKRHRVMTARDGLSALDILKSFVPDVMFIDLVMPNISGEKLCQIIRDKLQLKDVFIVIVSAIAKEQEMDFVGFGANACIAKCPFNKLEEYVLYVLDQLDSEGSCELSRQVIGLGDIYKREITQELLSSKKHAEVILSNISEGVLELTPEGKVVYANSTAGSLIGLPEATLLASHFSEFFPREDDRNRISNALENIDGAQEAINYDSPALLNGKQITLQISEVKDEGQQSAIAILNDISERKRADMALRQSEEKYRNILESINEGYYEVDLLGNLTFFNASLCEIFGYPRAELMGMNLRQLTDQEGLKKRSVLSDASANADPVKSVDWIIFRKDGTKRYVEASVSPIEDQEGQQMGFRGVIRDLTDRKEAERAKRKLEAQLRQTQKLESLGTLAGGIAHNFNNLLMGIQGNTSLMLYEAGCPHPYYRYLNNIERQVESGAKLTRQLLGYAREGKYKVKAINLNQVVKETSETFGIAKKEIRIHQEFAEELFAIEADRGQIEQALMNLCVNAADAMPHGGDLFLKTMNVTDEDISDKPYRPKPGNYILLEIRDTGTGMDDNTKARIFEPFFTTKEMGRGTGLGLASTYGIIKGHGGYIDVESEKGHGTTFSIYLPASEKKIQAQAVISDPPVRGSETILLVDDEEMVLEVGLEILKELGYCALAARGGREAIEIYKKQGNNIDMVILDMIIPDMAGIEIYDGLKQINPKVKVLLSSGYSIDGQAKEIMERGCNGFIQKPFGMADLSKKIGELLGKNPDRISPRAGENTN